jgi:hypothetical protein
MLSRDFKEFIESLNAHAVEYLIVGGYALAAHGHPRYTGDLDVWVSQRLANLERLMAALGAFGFGSLGLSIQDFAASDAVVQLGYPPGRIDLLTGIDGVQFDVCFARRQVMQVAGLDLPIIHVDDFKTNKRATGRFKDLADLEALESDPNEP